TVRKDLVDVRHNVIQLSRREDNASVPFKLLHVSHFYIGERIVIRSCAVWIEPEDAPSQMGVVGSRSTELIISLPGSETTASQILQLAAAPVIADLEVQFAIGAEQDFPTIVITTHGLTGVRLKRPQHNEVLVERQRLCRWIPSVSIDAITQ